jgi:hypothetical protein
VYSVYTSVYTTEGLIKCLHPKKPLRKILLSTGNRFSHISLKSSFTEISEEGSGEY